MQPSIFQPELLDTLKHETPFFLFSKRKIADNIARFKRCFPGGKIYYAMKANSEPEVLKAIAETDSGFETASIYELEMLRKLNIPAEQVIYGTAVKPAVRIKEFFDYGVHRFAFDSLQELEKIAIFAPGAKVYVRVRVNENGSVFKLSEKFGTEKENIVPLLLRAQELRLNPYGVSFHVGSQASNPRAWAEALKDIRTTIEELEKVGIRLAVINLGGGYPCAYASTEIPISLEEIAGYTLVEFEKLPYQPKLLLEPGRGIVADAGILVTSVIARIERRQNTWLFLDAGVYSGLFEAMAYQGSTRYQASRMRCSHDSGGARFALAGPTGDSPDVITRDVWLPQDITVGDKVIFHSVGAYSLTTVSHFNGFPKPCAYFI